MTRTYYELSNGTRVNTYAEAKASGLNYKTCYEPIKETRNIFIPKVDNRVKVR